MHDLSSFFKLPPYPFQREVWEFSRDLEGYALWHEMGCGKTIQTIGTAAWLYRCGEIDAMIVVAPNGVHANWTHEEIPKHLPESIETDELTWWAKKAKNKGTKQQLKRVLNSSGLAILVMAYSAITTEAGEAALRAMLTQRKCLLVADESGRIKTPGAQRTKRLLSLAPLAKYRRALTGTPIDDSPFNAYTQLHFLDPTFWRRNGIKNFQVFGWRFGVWTKQMNYQTGRAFQQLVRYRNLEELRGYVDEVGDRKLKADVLDLPAKIYTKHFFDLDPKQRAAYNEMSATFQIDLDNGELVSGDHVLARLTRLQQIACGYIGTDEDTEVPLGKNVRLAALQDVLEDVGGHVIIWARWNWEVDQIRGALGTEDAVYYEGRTSDEDRLEALQRFQTDGSARYFVAKTASAGEGLTLHRAKTVIYVSQGYSLRERLQSEDRAHRAGMSHDPVTYIDLIANETYDERILDALRGKRDVAGFIAGDDLPSWA